MRNRMEQIAGFGSQNALLPCKVVERDPIRFLGTSP